MKRRAFSTMVAIAAGRVIRADFEGGPGEEPARLWQASRKPGTETAEAVRAALALGGACGGTVWVLCDDFWAQSLALPAAQTDRLAPQELADALAFEVEPFSNQPPGETAVGLHAGKPVDGTTLYWVVECPRTDLADLQEIVSRAGGRLSGATHPGGLPVPLGEAQGGQPWRRVEKWQGGWIAVTGDGRDGVMVQSLATSQVDDTLTGWTGASEGLVPEAGAWKSLAFAGSIRRTLALDDEGALRRWLGAWARCLDGRTEKPALLTAPSLPPSFDRYVKVGLAAAGAMVVACLVHAGAVHLLHGHLAAKVDVVRQSVGQIERAERENAAVRQGIAELQRKQRECRESSELLARQRRAFPLLLRSLAAEHSPDVVVRELRPEGAGRIRIAGLGMTSGGVDDWAGRLSAALESGGWVVELAGKTAQGVFDDAGPWHFVVNARQADMVDAPAGAAVPLAEEDIW